MVCPKAINYCNLANSGESFLEVSISRLLTSTYQVPRDNRPGSRLVPLDPSQFATTSRRVKYCAYWCRPSKSTSEWQGCSSCHRCRQCRELVCLMKSKEIKNTHMAQWKQGIEVLHTVITTKARTIRVVIIPASVQKLLVGISVRAKHWRRCPNVVIKKSSSSKNCRHQKIVVFTKLSSSKNCRLQNIDVFKKLSSSNNTKQNTGETMSCEGLWGRSNAFLWKNFYDT